MKINNHFILKNIIYIITWFLIISVISLSLSSIFIKGNILVIDLKFCSLSILFIAAILISIFNILINATWMSINKIIQLKNKDLKNNIKDDIKTHDLNSKEQNKPKKDIFIISFNMTFWPIIFFVFITWFISVCVNKDEITNINAWNTYMDIMFYIMIILILILIIFCLGWILFVIINGVKNKYKEKEDL